MILIPFLLCSVPLDFQSAHDRSIHLEQLAGCWKSWSAREMHLRGTIHCTEHAGEKCKLDTIVKLTLHPRCGVVVEHNRLSGSELAYLLNSRYVATIANAPGGWRVEQILPVDSAGAKPILHEFARYRAGANVGVQLHWNALSMHDALSRPQFRAEKIETRPDGIAVSFDYPHSALDTDGWVPLQSGILLFQPMKPHLLKEIRAAVKYSDDMGRVHTTLSHTSDNLPTLLERTQHLAKRGDSVYRAAFDLASIAPPSNESAFSLAAFGLEEPFGVSFPRPTPWFLYAGITAGAILVLCVLLAWWQKRLQARA